MSERDSHNIKPPVSEKTHHLKPHARRHNASATVLLNNDEIGDRKEASIYLTAKKALLRASWIQPARSQFVPPWT